MPDQFDHIQAEIADRTARGIPQSGGICICSSFSFNGQTYGLAAPIQTAAEWAAESKNTDLPELRLPLDQLRTVAAMLTDLAWAHEETRRKLEAGEPIASITAA